MPADDIRLFLSVFLLVIGGILPIVNPVGSAPMFLAMTRGADEGTRQVLAFKVAVNAFLLLMGSLIFGAFVLKLFGLSIPVVQVAGGAVLCALGWNLLDSDPPVHADAAARAERRRDHARVLSADAAADGRSGCHFGRGGDRREPRAQRRAHHRRAGRRDPRHDGDRADACGCATAMRSGSRTGSGTRG